MSSGSSQSLEFQCPKCSQRIKAPANVAGRRIKCPHCTQPVKVPGILVENYNTSDDWLTMDVPPPGQKAVPPPPSQPSPAKRPLAARPQPRPQPKPVTSRATPQPTTPSATPSAARPTAPASTPSGAAKMPPTAPTEAADDDMFRLAPLDDAQPVAKTAAPKNTAKSSPKSTPNNSTPNNSTDSKRSVFDDDLPELSGLDDKPKPAPMVDLLQLDGLEQLVDSKRPLPMADEYEEAETSYRFSCKTCGTPQYASLDRVGKKVTCPDCHSNFVVPPPPPGWSSRKKKIVLSQEGVDVPLAPIEVDHHHNTLESERAAANDYLSKAKRSIEDDELEDLYEGHFDTKGFFHRTLGFMIDPNAVVLMCVYGLMFGGLFGLAKFSTTKIAAGGMEGAGYLLVLIIGVALVAILVAMPMLASGLALLESVANREPRVREWPGFNLFDNIGDLLVIAFALAGSFLPGMLVGGLIGRSGGAAWLIMTGMMMTCFALFPILLLSMLDNGSLFQPISGAVVRSIGQVAEAWGGYYLKSLAAFGTVTLLWYILLGQNTLTAALAGMLVPWLLFFTCQQIGALADAIAEHLSFDFTPAKRDDEDDEADQ